MENFKVSGTPGKFFQRCCLLLEKRYHAISEHHHQAIERWTSAKHDRQGQGTPQDEGQSVQAWSMQASQAAPAKGPWEPLGHHLSTSSQAKLSLSDHKA